MIGRVAGVASEANGQDFESRCADHNIQEQEYSNKRLNVFDPREEVMATATAARKQDYSPPPVNGDFYQIAGTLDAKEREVLKRVRNFVDNEVARLGLLQPVGPDSEVHFLPAIAGG